MHHARVLKQEINVCLTSNMNIKIRDVTHGTLTHDAYISQPLGFFDKHKFVISERQYLDATFLQILGPLSFFLGVKVVCRPHGLFCFKTIMDLIFFSKLMCIIPHQFGHYKKYGLHRPRYQRPTNIGSYKSCSLTKAWSVKLSVC